MDDEAVDALLPRTLALSTIPTVIRSVEAETVGSESAFFSSG
jgi:hypothetical protein